MTLPDVNVPGGGAAFSFAESGSAARYAKLLARLPAQVASHLSHLMVTSGNPDQAVLYLESLLEQHADEAVAAFELGTTALHACVALFGASQWLSQTLLQNPDLLQVLARPAGLELTRSVDDYREQFARFRLRSIDTALPVLLARFKRREYVRIFCRELLGLATVADVTAEISALSDVLIERGLWYSEKQMRQEYQGWPLLKDGEGRVYPARFSVMSLGKLGGNELNYSSDIDLLYLCDDSEDVNAIAIPAREFFTRLAQELTSVLSNVSADGQVFRVDLRLRPQGTSGEMVAGCAQALRYYKNVAHDWELQALLKLRLSAGDRTLAHEFVERVEKLVYGKEISLSAIQTAEHSLERIRRGAVRQNSRSVDVKNGSGGLREIEFAVQCLQRVYGGSEPWLRSSGTFAALQKLHDKGHIGDAEFRELCETYVLLRTIEHRLQCRQGVQSHRLPTTEPEVNALFRSLGEGGLGSPAELQQIMASASKLCAQVLRPGPGGTGGDAAGAPVGLGSPGAEYLARELAARSEALARALEADIGDPARCNLQRFLAAASTGEERIRVTLGNASWIERALPAFAQSTLATGILARHPEDVCALFDGGEERVGAADGTSISDRLRIEWRHSMLRLVGRSILEETSAWESLQKHSLSFDGIVQKALSALNAPDGFAVFAVGRLGTCELDAVSDADLVFVRSGRCNEEETEQTELCARSLVAMLSGYTREGSVISVDTRMRPHGNEGELVPSVRQLQQYFENGAKAWETLAFSKLRLIAGTEWLAGSVDELVCGLQARFAARTEFASELRAMRKRLEDAAGANNFKTGPGGLYDLDYVAGLLEAQSARPAAGKQLCQRIAELTEMGLFSAAQGGSLLQAIELFRKVDHAIRVVEGRSRKWLPQSDLLRGTVERVVGCDDLDDALRNEMRNTRAIFKAFFRD